MFDSYATKEVMRMKAPGWVIRIRAKFATRRETNLRTIPRTERLKHMVWVITKSIHIQAIFCIFWRTNIFHIFTIEYLKTKNIFTVYEVIPYRIFWINIMIRTNRMWVMKFLYTTQNKWIIIVSDSKFFYLWFVDRFFKLFVKNTVLLSCEICTTKTILTAYAWRTESAITTICAVLRIKYRITFITIQTFIRLIIFFPKIHIQAILRFNNSFTKHTVFSNSTVKTKITILRGNFTASEPICIVTIFIASCTIECHHRNIVPELTNLRKKWFIEVYSPPILKSRPRISMPESCFADFSVIIRVIHGDNILTCKARFFLIEITLITKRHTSLHTCNRSKCWSWDTIFFSAKNRWHMIVENHVSFCHKKLLSR